MSFIHRRADSSLSADLATSTGSDGCLVCATAAPCNCAANQECVSTVRLCDQCPVNQCIDVSSSSSQSSQSGNSGSGSSAATIAGPVVGGLVAGCVAIGIGYFIWKRRKRTRENKQLRLSKGSRRTRGTAGSGPASAASAGSRSAGQSPVQNNIPTTQVVPSPTIMVEQSNSPNHRLSAATLRRSLHSGRGTPSPTNVADPFDDSNASIHTQNVPITLVTSHSPSSSLASSTQDRTQDQSQDRERVRRITPPAYQPSLPEAAESHASLEVSTVADRSTKHLTRSSFASEGSHLSYLIDPPQISMATAVNLQSPNFQVLGGSPLTRAHSVKKSELQFGRESPKSAQSAGETTENGDSATAEATDDPFADTSAAVILEQTPIPKATSLAVDPAAAERMRAQSMNSVTTVTSSRADSMLEGIPFMDPGDNQQHRHQSKRADSHRASTATFGVRSNAGPYMAQGSNTNSTGSFVDAESISQHEPEELGEPRRPFAGEKPHPEYRSTTSSSPDKRASAVSDASSGSYRSGYGSMLDGIPFNLALTSDLSFDINHTKPDSTNDKQQMQQQ